MRSKYGLIYCTPLASRTGYKKLYDEIVWDYRGLLVQHREIVRELKVMKEMVEMRSENEKMRRQLAPHDNPNTPPSRRTFPRRKKATAKDGDGPARGEAPTRRQGDQRRHKGITSSPTPTKFKTHTPVRCPRCSNTTLAEEDAEVFDITEIPKPVPATTTCHRLITCRCGGCGLDGIRPKTDLPKRGSYGKNVAVTVFGNFPDRLTDGLNAASMGRHGVEMFTGTIRNIRSRTGSHLVAPAV